MITSSIPSLKTAEVHPVGIQLLSFYTSPHFLLAFESVIVHINTTC